MAQGSGSARDGSSAMFESLERRVLLAVTFSFDYSLDTQGFFDDPARREVLEAAGEMLGSHLDDELLMIAPGGPNTWDAKFTHPGTGAEHSITDLFVAEDTLKVFAGGRELNGALGRGGAGGFSAAGSQAWLDRVRARGQAGALGPEDQQTDFGPWGGAVAFDVDATWHVSATTDGLESHESDLLTVALHELTHLLGFSAGVASFTNLVDGLTFTGAEATGEHDGMGAPPLADGSHWMEDLSDNGQEVLMDPSVTSGSRKLPTPLDLAGLDDLGWDIDTSTGPGGGTPVALSALTGDGSHEGELSGVGDSVVLSFESVGAGRAFVQVVGEGGVDALVRVYDPVGLLLVEDAEGHVAATADVEFSIDGSGQTYTIEVVGVSGSGAFTARIDTEPATHFKYYPEGFANDQISEFVSITNPNDFSVTYTITLRYEDPSLPVEESIVAQEVTVGAGLRSGVTVSDKGFRAPDLLNGGTVIKNTPYAIIVSSDGPLAVSMSHFDFSIATGESFTDVTSRSWSFPRGERAPGDVNDFVVFYNPNDHQAEVTLTALVPGETPVVLTQTVGAMRRSGWGFNFEDELPDGVFGFVVTSEAKDMADEDDHVGIVAGLTHFDTVDGKGWGALGDPTGGSSFGVIPAMTRSADGDVEISLMNLGGTSQLTRITGTYLDSDLEDVVSNVTVPPGSVIYVAGASLGLAEDEPISLRYDTVLGGPLVVQAQETGFGDGTSTLSSTAVGTEFVFGDAFINANRAGEDYFETLGLFNPDAEDLTVTIEILFNDGVSAELTTMVPGTVKTGASFQEGFSKVDLHEVEAILNHKNLNFFGLRLTADSPFAVTLSHFDLFFGSGWGAAGAPIGFTTELDAIL